MTCRSADVCTYPLTIRPGVVVHTCTARWWQEIRRGAK